MKRLMLAFVLTLTMTTTAIASELLMFSMASCGYCQAFLKEVAPTYAESDASKLLPLRIISMDQKEAPKWYDKAYNEKKIDGIAGTPTFIIFDNGEEKARLIGYQGKERFYEDINSFVESNRAYLEQTAGKNPIPYEKETEMDYKQAQVQVEKNINNDKSDKLPNGVINSTDIMDHIYKTRTEAEIASMWLGCFGVHWHEIDGKTIYMPCEMEVGKPMKQLR